MRRGRNLPVALMMCCALLVATGCGTVTERARGPSSAPPNSVRLDATSPGERSRPDVDIPAAARDVLPSITVGAAVFDRKRGVKLIRHHADRQFRSASVIKLLIAVDALRRAETDPERVRRMLAYSDNQIASALWVEGGGDALVRRMSAMIGLRDTEPPDIPGRWGNTLLSARDVVTTYRYILNQLPRPTRELIVGALADTTRIASDGWYQHFGIPNGVGEPWAVKQGWSNSSDDIVVHTTGLAGEDLRYIVVLLLEDDLPASWATLRKAATAAAAETAPLVKRA